MEKNLNVEIVEKAKETNVDLTIKKIDLSRLVLMKNVSKSHGH